MEYEASHGRVAGRRIGAVAMVLAVALSVAACSDDSASTAEDEPSTSTTTTSTTSTTTTTEPPTLEERIVANMQGTQSEYQDAFGDSGPGVVFFHRGNWASEAFEWPFGSGEWCERGTFTWSVVDATSESEFTIVYDELTEDPDCVAFEDTRFTAVYSGSQEVNGRTVYDFAISGELGSQPITGTRTVCSDQWDDPEPCGLTLTGFEISIPPQD